MDDKSFESLVACGKVHNEVEVFKGYTFEFETLDVGEELEILKNSVSVSTDPAVRFTESQKWTLAYAIKRINGKEYTVEEKMKILAKLQSAVLNHIYASYLELLDEQNKAIDELKKK